MSMISITNVVNISVLAPATGIANYAINNLVSFTKETPAVSLGASLYAVYATAYEVGVQWGTGSKVYEASLSVFAQSPNIISGGGLFIVVPMLTDEVLEQAISRAEGMFYFGGCAPVFSLGVSGPTGYTGGTGINQEALRAAAVAQADRKLLFLPDIQAPSGATGLGNSVKSASLSYTRVMYHTDASLTGNLGKMVWSYASRGMSTNFSGSNTTSSMHLKALSGVTVDNDLTQTNLTNAATTGAITYPNIAGQPCTFDQGANEFFDDVYNLAWIIGALEVAGFNYLRQTATKIPQTEAGMGGLKSAYQKICAQAVNNGFIAPGEWTGNDTFGDPLDFRRNISQHGYYIYSAPISSQSTADRAQRKAPLVQIGIKYAGAINSTSVIINVNK